MAKRRGHGDGSIYQRNADGRWVGVLDLGYRNGKRSRRYVYASTRKEVAVRLERLRQSHREGTFPMLMPG